MRRNGQVGVLNNSLSAAEAESSKRWALLEENRKKISDVQEEAAQWHRELQQALVEKKNLLSKLQQLNSQVENLQKDRIKEFMQVKERATAVLVAEFESLQASLKITCSDE
jgi:uncharacterized protein (DUF3084 family)